MPFSHRMLNGKTGLLLPPEIRLFNRRVSTYQVCGYTGLIFGILAGFALAFHQGLSLWVLVGLTGTAMLTFLGLVMFTKIITGEEQIIYYHHEIAIIITSSVFLRLTGYPLLPYLDLTILGIGIFLAFGRIGCLMVGCCHGRPGKWGVCYSQVHAEAGFTRYYVGIPLFPIQLLESLWVAGVVVAGFDIILSGSPHGAVLAWYVIAYDIGRFLFEFLRGDPERPYYWGFSEGQWISLILMAAVMSAEAVVLLPFHWWHLIASIAVVVTMISVSLARRIRGSLHYRVFLPRHVKEICEAVSIILHSSAGKKDITSPNGTKSNVEIIPVAETSAGIRISTQRLSGDSADARHIAISSQKELMNERTARKLADLIMAIFYSSGNYPGGSMEFLKGNRNVFHLLIQTGAAADVNIGGKQLSTSYKVQQENLIYSRKIQEGSAVQRKDLIDGLLYSHHRLNTNTQLSFDVQCRLDALIRTLNEKGIIDKKYFEKQIEVSVEKFQHQYQKMGVGVMLTDQVPDKYNVGKKDVVKIDCAKRMHLCHASCCRLSFALSGQDVREGIVRWNPGNPYMIAHDADGYCSHLDRETYTCSIYKHQPVICQTYSCRYDKRIWLDFDNMIINPDIIRPDWPNCVIRKEERKQEEEVKKDIKLADDRNITVSKEENVSGCSTIRSGVLETENNIELQGVKNQ